VESVADIFFFNSAQGCTGYAEFRAGMLWLQLSIALIRVHPRNPP